VNSQPGWLYEETRCCTARVGISDPGCGGWNPADGHRSPSFGPEIEADDVQSMSIYTANFPAEYGRKMGGVVEVNTARDSREGLHGQVVLSAGALTLPGRSRWRSTVGARTRSR